MDVRIRIAAGKLLHVKDRESQNDRLRRQSQLVDATLYHNEEIMMECTHEQSNENLLQ
jgi:type II secretory pathway component PulJ